MNGTPWTADDAARLRRMNAAGMSDDAIGQAMNRHPKFIGAKRREANLTPGINPVYVAMMARINARRRLGQDIERNNMSAPRCVAIPKIAR